MVHGNAPTRFVVHGMPGIGKSQLALRYAATSYSQQRYSLIFWISGATVEKLNQGLARVLSLINHPNRYHPEQSEKLISARRWFEEPDVYSPSRWLLVLDNVTQDTIGFLKEQLPRENSMGNILLTTRSAAVAQAVASVAGQQHKIYELLAPDLKDAADLLLKEAEIGTRNRATASPGKAEDLAKCLGCLPLALSQAASFAKQTDKNLGDVLDLYQSTHRYEVSFE
jgi:hypothetical protein